MDKILMLAVAGSGKTTHLISNLDLERRFLLITYTISNYTNLRSKIVSRFGYFPPNITLYTYFSFLHGFCYRPFLRSSKRSRGIIHKPGPQRRFGRADDRYYMTNEGWLYGNRLAAFIAKEGLTDAVRLRIRKYFDAFYVDEIQDFAGHDFNFLIDLCTIDIDLIFVGDFYQHTYDTSRDGSVNSTLHISYDRYLKRFADAGLTIDTSTLQTSRRCSATVCRFITEKMGIAIKSHDEAETIVRYEDDPEIIAAICDDETIVKLFYAEHYRYACYSQNWGASKGCDHYGDVCVVLSPANSKALHSGKLKDISVGTRNKLYVACSRARGNLVFVPESALRSRRNAHQFLTT